MANEEQETRHFGVEIPRELWEKLDAIARKLGRRKESIYREIVEKGSELLADENETKN